MKIKLLFFILSLLVLQLSLNAEEPRPMWGTFGLEIAGAIGNTPQQNAKIASSSDGNSLVVWEDSRSGFTGIFAQKINGGGGKLWAEAGISVRKVSGNQTNAQLIEDGGGGVIVVWQDYSGGNADIFAQRIGRNGEILWGEDAAPVCSAPAGQFSPAMVSDGAGGAIITWHDYRGAAGEDIYAQRIDAYGRDLWDKDGIAVSSASGTQWFPSICSDSAGGAIIVWTDGRGGSADNNVFGQRIDGNGKILWEKDGISICSEPSNQERPTIISSDGGAIITWNDSRNGNLDIYAQKIAPGGSPLWQKEGVAVSIAPFAQSNPKLTGDGSGGAVIIWNDNRREEASVYAQRLAGDGKVIWEENGRLLARSPARQENPRVVKLNTPDWVVIFEDYRKGGPLLYMQKINSAGILLWPETGVPLALGSKFEENPSAALSSDNGVIVVWQDRRRGNFDVFAQKATADGSLSWAESGVSVCNTPGEVAHQNPEMVDAGRGETIVVFEDARAGFLNVYAQKIGRDGKLLWGRDGVAVAKVKAEQIDPQLVSDGAGGAVVCWEDSRNPNSPKIYVQRIGSSGKRAWERGSIPLTQVNSKQGRPLMASDGSGGAIIVWQDERDSLSLKDLFAQRVSNRGELLWGKNGTAVCNENGEQAETAIMSDGKGGAIVAWADYRRGERNSDIYAQRINGGGNLLWQKEGVLVCGAPDIQRFPRITSDKERGAVISWTDKGGGSYDIYAQRVGPEGKTLWLNDGIPVSQGARTQQNAEICPLAVVWEDYRYGNWDIFANTLSPQGKLGWGEGGAPIATLPLTQYAPQIACWKNEGIILTWEDYRSGKQYEIYFQKIGTGGKPAWQDNGVMVKTSNGARAPKILAFPQNNSFVVLWEDYTGGGKAVFGQKFTVD